ncbi:MAG: hypothetical protein R2848_03005 [Thermomicrobiales bacterium]
MCFADMIPSLSGEIEQTFEGTLPVYHVTGSLVPASDQPAHRGPSDVGLRELHRGSTGADPSAALPFEDYGGGSMELANVTVANQAAEPITAGDTTLVSLPLATPLEPGDSVTVALDRHDDPARSSHQLWHVRVFQ